MEKIMLVEYFVRAPKWNRVWDQRCVIMGSRPAHSPRAWSQFWQVSLDGFRAHFSALCIEVLVLQAYHIARWQSWKYKPPGSTEYLQYGHVCTPYLNVWRTWIQVQMFDHPTGIYSRGSDQGQITDLHTHRCHRIQQFRGLCGMYLLHDAVTPRNRTDEPRW